MLCAAAFFERCIAGEVRKFAFASAAMKAPVGLLSDGAVLRSKMEGLCPDKFRHDAQNADNARKNTAFPPVCKKCAETVHLLWDK